MVQSKKRKKTFVLVIPSFEDIFHSFYAGEIIKGVSAAASRLRVDVLIHITDRFDHRGWLDSSLLDPNYVDGILFADIDNDVNIVKKAIQRGMPVMVLNNTLKEPINCIAINNHHAAMEVVRKLVKMGHTQIATIAGDLGTQAGAHRLAGYRDALAENNLKCPKSYIAQGDFLRTPARAAAKRLLNLKNRPTAVFAASDVMAMELVEAAREMKIRIPEELSVVGFDDNPLNVNCSVALSTVSQPLAEMGRLGAEHLKLVCMGEAKLPVKIQLEAKSVMRASCASLADEKGS